MPRKGQKHSAEAIEKIRQANYGNKNNLGHHHSEETKQKLRVLNLGNIIIPKGTKFTQEHKQKIALAKLGERNPEWKGDNVCNTALHQWVRRHLKRPELCQICNNKPPHDLANITGTYNREFCNWKYLCRKCHMLSDGRLLKFNNQTFEQRSKIMEKAWITRKQK